MSDADRTLLAENTLACLQESTSASENALLASTYHYTEPGQNRCGKMRIGNYHLVRIE